MTLGLVNPSANPSDLLLKWKRTRLQLLYLLPIADVGISNFLLSMIKSTRSVK